MSSLMHWILYHKLPSLGQYFPLWKVHRVWTPILITMPTWKYVKRVLFSIRLFIQVLLFAIFSFFFALPAIRTYQKSEVRDGINEKSTSGKRGEGGRPLCQSKLNNFTHAGDYGRIWKGHRWIFGAFHHHFGKGWMEGKRNCRQMSREALKIKL